MRTAHAGVIVANTERKPIDRTRYPEHTAKTVLGRPLYTRVRFFVFS